MYQATVNGPGSVVFVNPQNEAEARFTAKATKVVLPSKKAVTVVTQELLFTTPKTLADAECSPCATDVINNSARIKLNFIRGDATAIAALRLEVNRLLDKALASYYFADGFVPPISSNFSE